MNSFLDITIWKDFKVCLPAIIFICCSCGPIAHFKGVVNRSDQVMFVCYTVKNIPKDSLTSHVVILKDPIVFQFNKNVDKALLLDTLAKIEKSLNPMKMVRNFWDKYIPEEKTVKIAVEPGGVVFCAMQVNVGGISYYSELNMALKVAEFTILDKNLERKYGSEALVQKYYNNKADLNFFFYEK